MDNKTPRNSNSLSARNETNMNELIFDNKDILNNNLQQYNTKKVQFQPH